MSFIAELYHGNIEPQAKAFRHGSGVQRAMDKLSRNEAILIDKLEGELRQLFQEYVSAWGEVNSSGEEDCFCTGFRLGAACAYDMFLGDSADYQSYLEE